MNRQAAGFPQPDLSAKVDSQQSSMRARLLACSSRNAQVKEHYELPRGRRRGSYSKSPVLDAATYARSQRAGRGLAWYGARTRHSSQYGRCPLMLPGGS